MHLYGLQSKPELLLEVVIVGVPEEQTITAASWQWSCCPGESMGISQATGHAWKAGIVSGEDTTIEASPPGTLSEEMRRRKL